MILFELLWYCLYCIVRHIITLCCMLNVIDCWYWNKEIINQIYFWLIWNMNEQKFTLFDNSQREKINSSYSEITWFLIWFYGLLGILFQWSLSISYYNLLLRVLYHFLGWCRKIMNFDSQNLLWISYCGKDRFSCMGHQIYSSRVI